MARSLRVFWKRHFQGEYQRHVFTFATVHATRGGSRNFERGVHKILGSLTVFRLWPLFEYLVVVSLWKFVLHSGVQPCIRLYGDTHRMKQYLLFWLKTKCLKCYTMYYILLINKLLSSMQVTWAFFFLQETSNDTFSWTFAVVAMQTCTPEWRTSFLREVAPAL